MKKPTSKSAQPCPCHSGQPYKNCCRSYHRGQPPPTAEALMRSRFSAYALALVRYLIETTDPDGPHYQTDTAVWRKDLKQFCQTTDFVGLNILQSASDQVTFHAQLTQQGRDASFLEKSLFKQIDGRWLYHSALEIG